MTETRTRRALLSVYYKDGIIELAQSLHELGWLLFSSGGTARAIADAGIPVTDVAELTGFPAILGHRVVTMHPKVHGGILADTNNPEHLADMQEYGIDPFDLVVINLYPFAEEPSIEKIDIGGPAMVRAAAKNHDRVGVVVDIKDYGQVQAEVREHGFLTPATRKRLAVKAFATTVKYDAEILKWLNGDAAEELPEEIVLVLGRQQVLRYGENPHQVGARYREEGRTGWWDDAVQHGGKDMSYLNVYDSEAAWQLVHNLGEGPAAVVIKHANPCGVALYDDIAVAYQRAHACDPVSAFGGIVAVNQPVTMAMAEAIGPVFTEVLIAPGYEPDALDFLMSKKKDLRIYEAGPPGQPERTLRSIDGGYLVQTPDHFVVERADWRVVTETKPGDDQWADIELAWRVVARTSSNAIVLVKDLQAFGVGCGQQNRKDAGQLACKKAEGRARGGVYASEAFFPYPDGLDGAIEAGANVVIQPGGSIRDDQVIKAADDAGLAMIFTNERHFRH